MSKRSNYRLSEADYQDLLKKSPRLQKQVLTSAKITKEILPVIHTPVKELLEDEIQALFFRFIDTPENQFLFPDLECVYAIPNGSNKAKAERWLFETTGLRSGVPDIHVPVSRKPYFGYYIEFKTWKRFNTKNNGCSENQLIWIERLKKRGNRVDVLWNPFEAIENLIQYLGRKLI